MPKSTELDSGKPIKVTGAHKVEHPPANHNVDTITINKLKDLDASQFDAWCKGSLNQSLKCLTDQFVQRLCLFPSMSTLADSTGGNTTYNQNGNSVWSKAGYQISKSKKSKLESKLLNHWVWINFDAICAVPAHPDGTLEQFGHWRTELDTNLGGLMLKCFRDVEPSNWCIPSMAVGPI